MVIFHSQVTDTETGSYDISGPGGVRQTKVEAAVVFSIQFFQAFFLQKFTMIDDPDIVRQKRDFRQNMAGDQDGFSPDIAQLPDKIPDLGNAYRIQTIDRFVQNQKLRIMHNGQSNGQTLFHTKRILGVQLLIPVWKIDQFQSAADPFRIFQTTEQGEYFEEIRRTSNIPVLMLTARAEAEDKIEGFESGADDYLAKPFLPRELLLRIKAILNRAYPRQERKVYLQSGMVDLDKAEVFRKNETFSLTARELQIFEKLWENAGRIVTTGALCETLCGEYWQGYETTLGTHIRHLREKIEENPSKPVSLITIKGIGYRLNVKEEIL